MRIDVLVIIAVLVAGAFVVFNSLSADQHRSIAERLLQPNKPTPDERMMMQSAEFKQIASEVQPKNKERLGTFVGLSSKCLDALLGRDRSVLDHVYDFHDAKVTSFMGPYHQFALRKIKETLPGFEIDATRNVRGQEMHFRECNVTFHDPGLTAKEIHVLRSAVMPLLEGLDSDGWDRWYAQIPKDGNTFSASTKFEIKLDLNSAWFAEENRQEAKAKLAKTVDTDCRLKVTVTASVERKQVTFGTYRRAFYCYPYTRWSFFDA